MNLLRALEGKGGPGNLEFLHTQTLQSIISPPKIRVAVAGLLNRLPQVRKLRAVMDKFLYLLVCSFIYTRVLFPYSRNLYYVLQQQPRKPSRCRPRMLPAGSPGAAVDGARPRQAERLAGTARGPPGEADHARLGCRPPFGAGTSLGISVMCCIFPLAETITKKDSRMFPGTSYLEAPGSYNQAITPKGSVHVALYGIYIDPKVMIW